MSKISEQKALEIYPDIEINWTMTDRTKERMIYADGYDQAMQDFLEKAEKYLKSLTFREFAGAQPERLMDDYDIEQFKNYMQDE